MKQSDKTSSVDRLSVSADTVKSIGDADGYTNVSNEALEKVADQVTFMLKTLMQDSRRFARYCKRSSVIGDDVNNALKWKNFEPIYGNPTGKKEILCLQDVIDNVPPKVPFSCSLKSHWLAIDGKQPVIPENPSPEELDGSTESGTRSGGATGGESLGASRGKMTGELSARDMTLKPSAKPGSSLKRKNMGPEVSVVEEGRAHVLSLEQQIYFREITEACVGSVDVRRHEALDSLATDNGLHQLLPRLVTFIVVGVRANILNKNLAVLIYLMRMIKSLLDNENIHQQMYQYIHNLIPMVVSCIVCNELCGRPETDNHWALRDFAAKQLTIICNKYANPTNRMLNNVTKTMLKATQMDPPTKGPPQLVAVYGAISALTELGPATIRLCLLPILPAITARVTQHVETHGSGISAADQKSVDMIRTLLNSRVTPILAEERQSGDRENLDAYRSEFGCLGTSLYKEVIRKRSAKAAQEHTQTTVVTGSTPLSTASGILFQRKF